MRRQTSPLPEMLQCSCRVHPDLEQEIGAHVPLQLLWRQQLRCQQKEFDGGKQILVCCQLRLLSKLVVQTITCRKCTESTELLLQKVV